MASSGLNKLSVQEAQNASLGQAGYKVIDQAGTANTGTAAIGVEYVAVTVIEGSAASIATTSVDTNAFPNLANPVPLGTTIFGRWSSVTITGTDCVAICYRG
jgi:hypothetical protein